MQTIHPLSPHIIAKIAAGEVVQNPASVVKELVENSLDADASFVEIHLHNGGLDSIRILDNGKGMSKEDLQVCFHPHTTSKISEVEDLFALSSFGFRGEALWSVASVSHMTIKSRERGAPSGYEIEMKEGHLLSEGPVGIPEGTDIHISNLFFNTPARKKFLKDATTEVRNVVDVILQFGLSFPSAGFKLTHIGKILLHLAATTGETTAEKHEERLHAVLGEYMAHHSLPLQTEYIQNRYGKVSGFVGRPQISGRNRAHQYLFVNNRAVSPTQISKYVSSTYGNLIEPRSYPVFVLFLEIPGDHIDVNIHPRKEEVSFIYEQEIAELVRGAIGATLKAHDLAYRDLQTGESTAFDPDQNNHESGTLGPFGGMDFSMASMLRNTLTPWNVKEIPEQDIIQVKNLYLIAPTEHGVLLIDQHAAHERILYEQFIEAFTTKQLEQESFELPTAYILEVPKADALLLEQELEKFQQIGFDIEPFGTGSFKICAVPTIYKNRDYAATILEVLQQLKNNPGTSNSVTKNTLSLDKETDRTLSFLACRTAIKAGEVLTPAERKRLVEKLIEIGHTNHAYTCPHGRPTHIEVSTHELDKMFKRK